ncbi:MAG TPA: MerR family DNA-binding transcriptional regulator, partial [Ilumatobacteraceae bacterium]|nr:MerR family DNA-binding transcriptional regulator [Ilumatobacteraceae bacterium]
MIAELDRARHLCSLDLRLSASAEDDPVVAIDVQATRDALADLLDPHTRSERQVDLGARSPVSRHMRIAGGLAAVTTEMKYQIGDVADTVGLSIRTMRSYEAIGVLGPAGRSAGGYRLYADSDV